MILSDRRGLAVTTQSRSALDHFDTAMALLPAYRVDPLAELDAAIAKDPGFVMAHCARAAVMVIGLEAGTFDELRISVEAAERLATTANARERAHTAAARAWLDRDFAAAFEGYGRILLDHPTDLLAMQVAHVLDFAFGQSTMLRDRLAWVLPHWHRDLPGYGYLLGMQAFGLEETGDYARAEAAAREALALDRGDVWAAHAIAHVMEMQARIEEGVDLLLDTAPDWSGGNMLAYHNWWHLALYALDLERYDAVRQLYDRHIRPERSLVSMEMVDATALLWRIHLRGIDVSARALPLADDWMRVPTAGLYPFNDMHALMAQLMAGRREAVDGLLSGLIRAADRNDAPGQLCRAVALPLANALLDFDRGRHAPAAEALLTLRHRVQAIGGSHAQRDLFHLTAVEAALRGHRPGLARALCAERSALRPGAIGNWRLSARAAQLSGDAETRQRADARAAGLLEGSAGFRRLGSLL